MLPALFSFLLAVTLKDVYNITIVPTEVISSPLAVPEYFVVINELNLTGLLMPSSIIASYTPSNLYAGMMKEPLTVFSQGMVNVTIAEEVYNTSVKVDLEGYVNFTKEAASSNWSVGDICSFELEYNNIAAIYNCKDLIGMINTPVNNTNTTPYPSLLPQATPTSESKMVKTAQNIAKGITELSNFNVEITTPADTAVHVELSLTENYNKHFNLSFQDIETLVNDQVKDVMQIANFISTGIVVGIQSAIDKFNDVLSTITVQNGPIEGAVDFNMTIPAGAKIALDAILTGYKCDATGYVCQLPTEGGIQIANLEITGLSDFDRLSVTLSSLLPTINNATSNLLNMFCNDGSGMCTISLPHKKTNITPPVWLLVVIPIIGVVVTVAIVILNVIRYKRSPVMSVSGKPVKLIFIIIEDTLYCLFIVITVMMFVCSNVTTAASVSIGNEMQMYSFSLVNTVHDLWHAGLKPLSALVMIFSGIYPFFKLLCMIICTVILHCPESRFLKIIDVIGKFSYLDIFVMLIMVSGLCIDNVAQVTMHPSFFLFFAATTASIVAGNYGAHLWRRNTTIRTTHVNNTRLSSKCEPKGTFGDNDVVDPTKNTQRSNKHHESLSDEVNNESNSNIDQNEKRLRSHFTQFFRSVWWKVSIPSALVILGLTLPVCVSTCLSFSVDGLANTFFHKDRHFNVFSIAIKAHWICLVMVIYSILLAPFFNALFFPSMCFLATWTGADVFLVGCIGGLLQVNQFVQFILGGDYSFAYSVHAHLHATLIPLLIASILTWIIYFMYVFNFRGWWVNFTGKK